VGFKARTEGRSRKILLAFQLPVVGFKALKRGKSTTLIDEFQLPVVGFKVQDRSAFLETGFGFSFQ